MIVTNTPQCRRAFTLMEVLIAMGIFAIGIIAIAAVFPTGISLQRETVRSLEGQRVAKNAHSIVQALAQEQPSFTGSQPPILSYQHETNPPNPGGRTGSLANYTRAPNGNVNVVHPMIEVPDGSYAPASIVGNALGSPFSFTDAMPISVRGDSAGQAMADLDPSDPGFLSERNRTRDYYWYPFIQPVASGAAGDPPTWKLYIMVMKGGNDGSVPEPRSVAVTQSGQQTLRFNATGWNDADGDNRPDWIAPGDWVLTDVGGIHRVATADADSITVDDIIVSLSGTPPTLVYFAQNVGDNDTLADDGDAINQRSPIARIEVYNLNVPLP
jgi:prepilin-type N-terminal cleavage/methylation domain-containing protein